MPVSLSNVNLLSCRRKLCSCNGETPEIHTSKQEPESFPVATVAKKDEADADSSSESSDEEARKERERRERKKEEKQKKKREKKKRKKDKGWKSQVTFVRQGFSFHLKYAKISHHLIKI